MVVVVSVWRPTVLLLLGDVEGEEEEEEDGELAAKPSFGVITTTMVMRMKVNE
jgi:hypothetical protein